MTRIQTFSAALIAACVLFPSCDESLPPRDARIPRIEAQIGTVDSLVNVNTYPEQEVSAVIGSGGSVRLTITNLHDEMLQGEYSPAGWIDIWLERDPSLRTRLDVVRLLPVDPHDIQDGMLTLPPGKPVRFVAQWSHRTDDGEPYWMQSNRAYYVPAIGYPYFETIPITFSAEARVQLFDEVGVLYSGRTRIRLVYREHIVGGE
jgi:hypothetical protein